MFDLFASRAQSAPVPPSVAEYSSVVVPPLLLKVRVSALLFSLAMLGGCTVGNWHICGPQTPQAYCDKKAYQELVNPTPPRDYWNRADVDADARDSDWQACGGNRAGGLGLDRVSVSGQETADLSRQKFYDVQRCMMSKGYQYIGTCEGDIPSRFPACQAGSE